MGHPRSHHHKQGSRRRSSATAPPSDSEHSRDPPASGASSDDALRDDRRQGHSRRRRSSAGKHVSAADDDNFLKQSLSRKLLGHDEAALYAVQKRLQKADGKRTGAVAVEVLEDCLLKGAKHGARPTKEEVAWLAVQLRSLRHPGEVRYNRMRSVLSSEDATAAEPERAVHQSSHHKHHHHTAHEHSQQHGHAGGHAAHGRRAVREHSPGSSSGSGGGGRHAAHKPGHGRRRRSVSIESDRGCVSDGGAGSASLHSQSLAGSEWLDARSERAQWALRQGSVGQWLQDVASPLERKLFHKFIQSLEKFEYKHGLDHYRYVSAAELPDGAAVVSLGPSLKASIKFFV